VAGVVTTIRDKCKRCYTCVRNCPAKAIKVEDGQAQVIEERCIACGNCYRVCAQKAKEIRSDIDRTWAALDAPGPVIACLAPSFAAIFADARPGQVVSAVRALGFDEVLEVAFGAQLVSREYAKPSCSPAPANLSSPPLAPPSLPTFRSTSPTL
jgi:NAD-dependent dihydropyrimidine dehydrogenase PreA subunit